MKTTRVLLSMCIAVLFITGCTFRINGQGVKLIEPSDAIITKDVQVSGFDAIEFTTFGKIVITQGDSESLTIRGSDNIVPLVDISVSGGTLKIRMEEDVNITGMNVENTLTFTIAVKDLSRLNVSGAGRVEMASLSTDRLNVDMSGAGQFLLDELTAQSLDVSISGVGNVEIAGEVTTAKIDISGAGPVNAPDLKIRIADVTISGIGSATLWVTDQLTGNISGAGNVSYYGNPKTSTLASGIGAFKSLGSK